jgi:cytochrome c peroxidase
MIHCPIVSPEQTDPTLGATWRNGNSLRNRTTGGVVRTTDPGRALITGKWSDMSLFKGPILRGLPARAPYFHNGFAATLMEVIDFSNRRFNIGLSEKEQSDLLAFLRAL